MMTKKILLNIIIVEGNLLNDPYRTKSLVRSIDHQGARVNLWRFFLAQNLLTIKSCLWITCRQKRAFVDKFSNSLF